MPIAPRGEISVLERGMQLLEQLAAQRPTLDALQRLRAVARWALQQQLKGEMPTLPSQNSTLRAELLSPLGAPSGLDADVLVNGQSGLAAGQYIYRVAAVLAAADANNPGGETLAGDVFPVQLPTVSGKLQLVLQWSKITNAASYRIYRSPKVNDAAGQEQLIGTVQAGANPLQFVDDGTVTPSGGGPLPLGSLGAFRTLPQLNTARIGAGVAAITDPGNASQVYLYVTGGNSGTLAAPTPLASVESLTVTIAADGSQTFGAAFATSANSLPSARWAAPALAGTSANNNVIAANAAYLYVASGASGAVTTLDKPVYVASIGANGVLGAFASTGSVGVGRSAFGGVLVNNQVIALGGFQGSAGQTNSDSAKLASATALGNFNSLGGGVLTAARALQGTAIESAFIYQLGGATANGVNTAQATTEQTIW